MPIRWSARQVAQSLDELEKLVAEAEPKLRECQAKALETAKLPNLPEYMTQPIMSFTYKVDDVIGGLKSRIKSARGYIPKEALAREQAEYERVLAYWNGDTQKAEMTMALTAPKPKETPKEQMSLSVE